DALPLNEELPLVVRRGDRISAPVNVILAPAHPAIFTRDLSGKGPGIFADANFRLIDAANPARAGSVLITLMTGLGEVEGSPGRARLPVTMTIGGVPAEVAYAGLAPGFAGIYQVNATVPEGVPGGDAVPVVVKAGDYVSAPVTLVVR